MIYINVIDENLSNTLLSNGYKLLNLISDTSNQKIWTFQYNPSLFCLDFNDKNIKSKCFISDSLKLTF